MPLIKANPDNIYVTEAGALVYVRGNNPSIEFMVAGVDAKQHMAQARNLTLDTSVAVTLTTQDCGRVCCAQNATGTQTYTLPAASSYMGNYYTFVCNKAGGEIRVLPTGSDTIRFKATGDQGATIVTAAGAGIKNTVATQIVGDSITLYSDGTNQWVKGMQSGIWGAI